MTRISVRGVSSLVGRLAVLPLSMLLTSFAAQAQAPDTAQMARAMVKYKSENSVFTNYTERLEIKYQDGELVASSKIKNERLLTGELAPAHDHYDHVAENYFDQLTMLDAVAYIPQKGGNYRQLNKHFTFGQGAGMGEITDASYYTTSFAGLTKGSVVRLTATQDHPDIAMLPTFVFADDYPILHAEYEVVAPAYVDLKFVFKGENTGIIKQTKETVNGNVIYRFTADNVPGYKSFGHVPSNLYYMPHIVTYIASYKLPGQAKDTAILATPADLYRNQFKYVGYMNVKQDTMLKNLVARLTKGDVTDRQKARHLYEWVQNNVNYIAFEIGLGGWIPREADTVCRKMYGDCKDMSSLLTQMGRMAGLKTYFAWIGTASKPYTFEETPVPIVSNHMICALKLGDEWIFMDGTHSNLPFGTNRHDIQGKEAMIAIDKDNYKIVTIPVVDADKNVTVDSTFVRISDVNDNDLKGRLKVKMSGYAAWNLGAALQKYTRDKEEREKIVKHLTGRGSDKFLLNEYKLKIRDTGNRDISIIGDFIIGDYVRHIKKDVIVNMNVLRTFEDDYIDTTDRKVAWYHDYKNVRKEIVVMEIPEGYKVTYLPKNATGKLDDNWNYSISYKADKKFITLTKEYKVNTLTVGPKQFVANNQAISALENQYKESVVLTAKK